MTSSKFPLRLDMFQTKTNAQFSGDTNGSYVMAEDINELQDAIYAIEETLGVNPQGSKLTVGERITLLEDSSVLRVPPALVYFGSPATINGSVSIDDAVAEYLKYNYVVLGNGVEQLTHSEHTSTTNIITQVRASRDVQFYGYVDCGVTTSNLTISQIQVNIKLWKDMGVTGIYCANFGFEKNVSRERQNEILDSIHQYDIVAVLQATNPDEVFSDAYNDTMNPNWLMPNIAGGDFFHFEKFVVDTSDANIYTDIVTTIATLKKLHQYRISLGIRILATPLIKSNITQTVAQTYFEYAHAMALLGSVDAFYPSVEGYGASINTVMTYNVFPIIGDWYTKNPVITVANGIYTRKTSFGQLTVDTANKKYSYDGIYIPYEQLRIAANTIDGTRLKDNSVEDKKIKNYDGGRLIDAINNNADKKINVSKLMDLNYDDITQGSVSVDALTANVVSAIEANIGKAIVTDIIAGNIDAKHIVTGTLDAERMSGNIVQALDLYAQTMVAGSATINTAVIGDLSVDNMKANVVNAINGHFNSATIDSAKIGDLEAEKITSGDIDAQRIQANVLSAIAGYMESAAIDNAVIKRASIGFLKADGISANIINAINGHFDSITIDSGKIGSLEVDNIKASVIEAINANITGVARINGGVIQEATIGGAQISEGSITNAHVIDLDAGKIVAGTLDTSKVTIQGNDGMLRLSGNRIQVFDNSTTDVYFERISIGDINGDGTVYGFQVRGSDGTTVLYDEKGVYNEGITDGAITNAKIGDDEVDGRVIKALSITADHIQSDSIISRLIASEAVQAQHIAAGTITAGSAIIADGAIGSAMITKASIDDSHIKSLSADKIVAGRVKAEFVEIGANTVYENGYNPSELDSNLRNDMRLTASLPTSIIMNANGITAISTATGGYARLDYRGLYIQGGAILIENGLSKDNLSSDVTSSIDKSESFVDNSNDINTVTAAEKIQLNKDWITYAADYVGLTDQCDSYWPTGTTPPSSIADYENAYNSLNTFLNITPDTNNNKAILASDNLSNDSVINGSLLTSKTSTYVNTRATLQRDIAIKARELVDTTEQNVQDYSSTLTSVQTAANTANALLRDIADDNKLTAGEKQDVLKEWNIIVGEKANIDAQADLFSITTEKTTYGNAYQALGNYLNGGTTWTSGDPLWLNSTNIGTTTDITPGTTFRANFKSYYDARTALLKTVAAGGKSYTDTAQSNAQTYANTIAAVTTVDNTKVTYFPFNQNLCATNGLNPNSGYITTLRKMEGNFGGAIAVEDGTTNLLASTTHPMFVSAYDGKGNYVFGSATNMQQDKVTMNTPIGNADATKVHRINSGVSQSDYVQLNLGSSWAANEKRTFTLYYYGTTGTVLQFYMNASVGLQFDKTASTSINITVPTNKWTRVEFTITNTTATTGTYGSCYIILHNDTSTATLANTEYWLFTGYQSESKGFSTSYVNGTRAVGALSYSGTSINPKQFSIGGWYKWCGGTSTDAYFVELYNSTTDRFNLKSVAPKAVFQYHNGTAYSVTGTKTVGDGNWHLLVFTVNGTTGKVYVDGVLDGTVIIPSTVSSQYSTLNIGGRVLAGTSALYDDLFIKNNEVLSDTDILAIYNAKIPFYDPVPKANVPVPSGVTITLS